MNYIRTKDGRIIDIAKTPIELYGGAAILKQADTIEELCDEFVLTDDKGKKHYKSVEGNVFYIGAVVYKDSVRGAIWTDKGLIYVAKMNEKGELELL